jgi:7-cyano-7-deazaguanine synthase
MAVVIYSGGLDSFTLLHHVCFGMLHHGGERDVIALSFNYHQKHRKELDYAKRVCRRYNIPHMLLDLSVLRPLLKGSALSDPLVEVPKDVHYADPSQSLTVVPGRNTIMLAVALSFAEGNGHDVVYYGAHAGDHVIYPDCRPEYINAMAQVYGCASEGKVALHAPFQAMHKADIIRLGLSYNLDYSQTWTCYEGGDEPCGKCGSCVERAEGFAQAGAHDPAVAAVPA